LGAPVRLTVNPGKVVGEVVAAWTKGVAVHGFGLQHATDPTNAATLSGTIPCTKSKPALDGMPSGAALAPWPSWSAFQLERNGERACL
jgi:hypothetical protein